MAAESYPMVSTTYLTLHADVDAARAQHPDGFESGRRSAASFDAYAPTIGQTLLPHDLVEGGWVRAYRQCNDRPGNLLHPNCIGFLTAANEIASTNAGVTA